MIWIMAGTSESKKIIAYCPEEQRIITVATALGKEEFQEYPNLHHKAMSYEEMLIFIDQNQIRVIIDATHPFAANASQNAILAAKSKKIPYFRFERKNTFIDQQYLYESYEEVIQKLQQQTGNILITTGIKNLNCYQSITHNRLFIKIIPHQAAFLACEKAGFSADHIIALKGILSIPMLQAIIQEFQIKHLVMKDSGCEGGTNHKLQACLLEKVNPYVIKREQLNYPQVFHTIDDLVHYLEKTKYFLNIKHCF
ncbi:MAG: precorrin-6A reductase [Spirochaetes bacterium]|nr:precorrin-6A reductase [Spirochaetota bacterium]